MASSYSTRLRLELIGNGEQAAVWGTTCNFTLGTLIEDAICGLASGSVTSGDWTLSVSNPGGSVDEARKAFLVVSGTQGATARNVIVPALTKGYVVRNTSNGTVTVKTAAGTGVALPAGAAQSLWCDGTNVLAAGNPTGVALTLPGVTTTGASVFGPQVSGASLPVLAYASTAAVALQVAGRSSDNIGGVTFTSNDGVTEYARVESTAANGLSIWTAGRTKEAARVAPDGTVLFGYGATIAAGGSLTLAGGNLAVNGAITAQNGDLKTYRAGNAPQGAVANNHGLLALNAASTAYLYFDGAGFNLGGSGSLTIGGNTAWHTGNLDPSTYLPKAGGTISGTLSVDGGTVAVRSSGNRILGFYDLGGVTRGALYQEESTNTLIAQVSVGGGYWVLDGSGNLTASGNVLAPSDARLKGEFRPFTAAEAGSVAEGLAAAVTRYQRTDLGDGRERLGFLAQGVQAVLPEAVQNSGVAIGAVEDVLTLDDRPILAALAVALDGALARIAALEARLNG